MHTKYGLPKNLMQWAEDNKQKLSPPVCNAAIFEDGNYIINMVGGGNQRTDFHDNSTEELFYQLRGTAHLIIYDRGQFERIDLKEGDIFLQPPHLIHSPQRPDPNGLCLLIESPRPAEAIDSLIWYCANCAAEVWKASLHLEDLVEDLPRVYNQFYALKDPERICSNCGTQHSGKDFSIWHDQLMKSDVCKFND